MTDKKAAREKLRKLIERGLVDVGETKIEMITGRMTTVPAYRLREK
jgi:hypothetical protein